jgi:GH24 family phage-related lysozyme (muramidase)
MKRPVSQRIFEAGRQLRENSPGWLRAELERLRGYQQKSLEPEGWQRAIDEIERKLASPQAESLLDFSAYVLREKNKRSWQQIGDQLYRNVKSKEARRLRARRAWERADCRLESDFSWHSENAKALG